MTRRISPSSVGIWYNQFLKYLCALAIHITACFRKRLQNIRGAENSYWHNQIYDFQMLFDKHFPFEPPRLHFPSTVLNKKSIKHQLVGRNGNLDLNCVSKDQWTCASTVVDIIREVQTLFCTDPLYSISDVVDSFLFELPEEPMFGLIAYLSLGDILRLSSVCKKALLILHSNDLWAKIYYTRCQVPAAVLYNTGAALLHAGPGPLREFTAMSKSFQWRHSREAFVRAHQCNRVLRHYKVPSLQSLAAGELSVLLPLAYPAEMAAARALPWTDDNDDEEARMSTKQPQPAGQKRAPSDHHGLDEQINWLGGAPTYSSLAEIQAQEFMSQVMPPFDYPHNLLHHPHHHHHHFMQQQHQQHQQQHGHVNATLPPGTNVGYFAALKYRALRSCRLAQWLGGSNCITANLVHNYWNNLPVTFLQFLCSLSVSMGQQGTPRVELAQRLSVEATLSVRECHQHMRYTEQRYQQLTTGTMSTNGTIGGIIIDTIDATDITATAEGTGAAVATTAGDPSSSIGDDLNADAEQIAEFGVPNAKLFAEGLPTPAPPFPGRSSGSSSAPVSVHEVFGGSAVDTRVLRSRDPAVRARLELVQDLVRNNGARSASVRENCDNFESIRTV